MVFSLSESIIILKEIDSLRKLMLSLLYFTVIWQNTVQKISDKAYRVEVVDAVAMGISSWKVKVTKCGLCVDQKQKNVMTGISSFENDVMWHVKEQKHFLSSSSKTKSGNRKESSSTNRGIGTVTKNENHFGAKIILTKTKSIIPKPKCLKPNLYSCMLYVYVDFLLLQN